MSASAAAQAGEAAARRTSSASVGSGETNVRGVEREDLPGARQEVVGPAPGVEPARPVGGQPGQHLAGDVVRQHPQPRGGGERRVAEVDGRQVGPALDEAETQQAQVVVLHQHRRPMGGGLGHRLGEGVVDLAVRLPRLPQVPPERRLPGKIVEAVVHEPQDLVADHVVGQPVDLGVHRQQPGAEALGVDDPGRGRLPVAVRHGRRHPQGAGTRHERREAGHQPAGAPPGDQRAAAVAAERQGASVRYDDDGTVHGR